jgi:hypothetical protein
VGVIGSSPTNPTAPALENQGAGVFLYLWPLSTWGLLAAKVAAQPEQTWESQARIRTESGINGKNSGINEKQPAGSPDGPSFFLIFQLTSNQLPSNFQATSKQLATNLQQASNVALNH